MPWQGRWRACPPASSANVAADSRRKASANIGPKSASAPNALTQTLHVYMKHECGDCSNLSGSMHSRIHSLGFDGLWRMRRYGWEGVGLAIRRRAAVVKS